MSDPAAGSIRPVSEPPDLERLGVFLRQAREKSNLTPAELAERLGWPEERITMLENGGFGLPSLPTLAQLASAVAVPLGEMLAACGYDLSPVPDDLAALQARYVILQHLIALPAVDVGDALDRASDLLTPVMGADKIDAFLFQREQQSLVAAGTSNTPMARRQMDLGLDILPLANGGEIVRVYETGEPFLTNDAGQVGAMLPGMVHGLGVGSALAVPIRVAGEISGVLVAQSAEQDRYTAADLDFLLSVADWIGLVVQRAQLVQDMMQQTAVTARNVAADELITVLSHDMANILTPLRGRLDLIRRRALREGQERLVEDSDETIRIVSRLHRMIQSLLDVSRLDRGMFALAPAPLDLVPLVREVARAEQRGDHEIRLRLPDRLLAEADPDRMYQVLHNLVHNATQHTPAGTPITISLREEERACGSWAVLEVHDDGPGVPPDLAGGLFTRYTSGPQSHGLGLGLYLARGIAEAHRGTLTLDSRPGEGTTFTLSVPVTSPPPAPR